MKKTQGPTAVGRASERQTGARMSLLASIVVSMVGTDFSDDAQTKRRVGGSFAGESK